MRAGGRPAGYDYFGLSCFSRTCLFSPLTGFLTTATINLEPLLSVSGLVFDISSHFKLFTPLENKQKSRTTVSHMSVLQAENRLCSNVSLRKPIISNIE